MCFNEDSSTVKIEGENAGNSSADGPDHAQPKEVKGVTLDCRYSYNNDPAKYNEQPLPTTSAISIRSARGKQVRNIRLRPRQTLCSKCKAVIHDTKAKSPNKISKPDGEGQEQEAHPHNTRYRAALSGKHSDGPNSTAAGPILRSGLRNRRADSTPKVLLENIRPKRDVKPTAKKKDADAAQKSRLTDSSSKKNTQSEEQTSDSGASRSDSNKRTETIYCSKKEDESSHVMIERSVSLDNPTALSQYNKQPIVRLEKSAVNSLNIRTDGKEEKQEKAPTISIVNIRSTPAITISYGGAGDRDVVKIPPRLPGAELKSPDGHSTADESPAPVSPAPPPSPPQKKVKKASRRTRDKQRYRVVNDTNAASEVHAPGLKIAGHHRKHKRKHKHRHASSEDENYNSEMGVPPPAKLPAIITKLSVVPPVNDMNGNEKKGDTEVLKDSSNETPTRQEEPVETMAKSPRDISEAFGQVRKEDSSTDFGFDSDPLSLKNEGLDPDSRDTQSDPKSPCCVVRKETEFTDQSKSETNERSPIKTEVKPFAMWGSPVKIEAPPFEMEGSPARIEAPPFQSDDSQDGLIIGPLRIGASPVKDDSTKSFDDLSVTPPPAQRGLQDKKEWKHEEAEEKKESVPYGVGVFEDLTPDEDEGDHDDHSVSQPMYQLPKKPRLMYGWEGEGLSSASHVTGYLSKKSAAVLPEGPSTVYPSRSRVYQNGPGSYFSPSPGPSSMYPGNPTTAFPNSPAPRIQNSPPPMIQKSPVPIFNYNSSRYQGSPNRRFGSSPSRRYHSIGEGGSLRQPSVMEGNLRHSGQSSLSRFQGHDSDQFQTRREGHSSSSGVYQPQSESDLSHSSRYSTKFGSRSTIRYQPSSDKSAGSRYTSQTESSSVSRLPSTEDASLVTKSYRAADSSSKLRYVSSSGDSSSVPRFAIPSDGSSSAPKYSGQRGSSSLTHYSNHPSEGSLPNQYQSLSSTELRFQNDTQYKNPSSASIPSSPSGLSLQTSGRSLVAGSVYHSDKDRKSTVLTAPRYETVDTSALFMTHSHDHNPASSGDSSSVPSFLSKPSSTSASSQNPVTRVPSIDSAKPASLFAAPSGQNAPVPFLSQDSKFVCGTSGGSQGSGVLFRSQGQSSSSLTVTSRPSSSGLSQGHVSDSEDDCDNAVPGFVPQDISRLPMMKIQTQNLSSCMTEDRREIRVGDVQWGKVQGFPWWPCRVMSIKLTHRDHREQELIVTQVCHVSWFGSTTVSDLHPSELRPFREEFPKRHMKKKRGPYQVAVQQAMLATELTPAVLDASRASVQQPINLGLMHDLVS